MASTSRVFRLVEGELAKNLELFYSIVGDPLRHGKGQIRLPKRFTLEAWARNDSPVVLRDIRGAITPAAAASFAPTSFRVERLEPREQRRIARVEVRLRDAHGDAATLDRVAAISVVAYAVLSDVRFQDTYRTLGFAQPAASVATPPALVPARPWPATEREDRPAPAVEVARARTEQADALGAWVRLLGTAGATGKS
jgi:hypothetical protein